MFPSKGNTYITRDMCSPGSVTHIAKDIYFPGRATHMTRDMFP